MPHQRPGGGQPPGDQAQDLLAMVAHELRQPLTGLLGALATIHQSGRGLSAAQRQELLAIAHRQGRQLQQLLEQLLVGLPASTVYRVLCRHGLNRLAWMDRPTGQLIRRYERAHPGELIHVDVKKLGRIPPGGGHRVHGRDSAQHRGRDRDRWRGRSPGYDFVHAAVDDHSRLAYAEVLADEQAATCAEFLRRAGVFFAAHGIAIQRVLTDMPSPTAAAPRSEPRSPSSAQPAVHPSLPPPDQRQGRAVQPHLVGRMGLPRALPHQHRAHRCSGQLAAPVQPSPRSHRARRPPTHQPRQQRP